MRSSRESRDRIGQIALVFVVLLTTVGSLAAAPPGADAKIDPKLIQAILDSDDGTAPFFVVFADRTPLAAAYGIQDWQARGRFVMRQLQATADRSQNGVRGYLQGRKIDFTSFWVENKIYVPHGTLDLARDLARRGEVAAIIPEEIYAVPTPQASGTSIQSIGWNLSQIGADQAWGVYNNKGNGIVIANIDTGVQYNHPALVNQYRGNLRRGGFSHSGNWYDPTNTCGAAPCDNVGHGTHTMGTMAGDDGTGSQIGVAPGAKWIACKGCSTRSCASSALIACAQWVIAPGGNPGVRANIVNKPEQDRKRQLVPVLCAELGRGGGIPGLLDGQHRPSLRHRQLAGRLCGILRQRRHGFDRQYRQLLIEGPLVIRGSEARRERAGGRHLLECAYECLRLLQRYLHG